MWTWLVTALGWLFRREGAAVAIDGFDRLTTRLETRLEVAESRLDDCDKDRRELHKRADDCDEARRDLRIELSYLKDKLEVLDERTNGT